MFPPTVNEFFMTHLENISLTQQDLQGALDFYTAHLPSWTESKGYLLRQALSALYPTRIEKRKHSGAKSPANVNKNLEITLLYLNQQDTPHGSFRRNNLNCFKTTSQTKRYKRTTLNAKLYKYVLL